MFRRASFALLGLVLVVATSQACRRNEPPPFGLDPGPEAPTVFPPPDTGWTDRAPLTLEGGGADEPIHLTTPALDDEKHFETEGQSIRLAFSEPLFDEKDVTKTPLLKIAPAVAGKVTWQGGGDVVFQATKPFDPEKTYTVELPELVTPAGRKLEGGFKATFRAIPSIEIAGKTVSYLPKPGRARVVTMLPSQDDKLGATQDVVVIYDQPIDLGLASKLINVTNADDKRLSSALRHPTSDAFDGVKVDRRMVVLVKPPTRKPGESFKIEAKPQHEDDESPTPRTFEIAEPGKFESVRCGSSTCEVSGSKVTGEGSSSLELQFNNPVNVAYDEGKNFVHVTPAARNLYISGYGTSLRIGGSFAPSTTYTIRVEGLKDAYGSAIPPAAITFVSSPLPASIAAFDRAMLLDEAAARKFAVTTRNVQKGELAFWALPKGDAQAFGRALEQARAQAVPEGEPVVVPFKPQARRDQNVDTDVDLRGKLEQGRAYIAQARITAAAPGARESSAAAAPGKAAVGLVSMATPSAVGAHVHHAGDTAVVQVFRLGTGEPVGGATVAIGEKNATTDPAGVALVPAPASESERIATITDKDTQAMVPFGGSAGTAAKALYPELSAKDGDERATDAVAMILTDRGIYRPGSKMFVKGIVRKVEPEAIRPLGGAKVRLRVVDPMDKDVADDVLTTNDKGDVAKEIAFASRGHTGRFRIRLEHDDGKHTLLAEEYVRVADFEAPKFKVDVERDPDPAADKASDKVKARVVAKYLFGAPMSGARVSWVLKKAPLAIRGGALGDAGLSFGRERTFEGEDDDRSSEAKDAVRPVTGEAELPADGALPLDIATGPLAKGPTEITLEADVSDASNRHVAGNLRVVKDPFGRHAGLKLAKSFGDASERLKVDLGVVDTEGHAVPGAKVSARLERVTYARTSQKAESGAIVERWHDVVTKAAECEVTSAAQPVACELAVPRAGSYRVTARIDGRDGGSAYYYGYTGGYVDREGVTSSGKKVQLVLDKGRYRAGETAHVLVRSPFAAAIALLTVEQGGVVRHESRRITGSAATFDVPVTPASAPWLHATVTLLPIGETEPSFRVGVVRIPVGSDDAKLDVTVASAKKSYEAREEAEVTIEVKKNGQPLANADVALGVVDEGVLRLTAFHPKSPAEALRPGMPLAFTAFDSRAWLVTRRERAHVAGGGDSEGEESVDTRRKFVETAAWLPNLTTDAQGRIVTKVKLPDNLTELRMTAVAVDQGGSGGTAESSFVVTKPVLLEPVMPRFATRGDKLEAAAMVHNNTDAPVPAKVTVAGELREVTIPPKSRARVAVPMTADRAGTRKMLFSVEALGAVRDKVEIPFVVDEPGIEEHPQIAGVFGEKHEITLAVPEDAIFDPDAALSIKTGSALYPELGHRLSYLLDYPHGCVEQTTSSTIPLIAARTLLPWTGVTTMEEGELRKRIDAGVTRLASMQTSEGGLAYWPGGNESNTYGSAYALRALIRAREMGIERKGLVEGVARYLGDHLSSESNKSLRVSIAEVLAEAHKLPESAADSLWDAREDLDVFGLGSAAIALSSIPNQDDRVKDLLDRLEKAFDDQGNPTSKHDEKDYHYWGSHDRDRAQATIALTKLRPTSRLLPVLTSRLARKVDSYTTQATAWSLLALGDYVGTREPSGGVDVAVKLEGRILDTFEELGGDNKEIRIPLKDLAGKKVKLLLSGKQKTPSAFAIDARYKRPLAAQGGRVGRRAASGVTIHRVYTDPTGKPVDLAHLKAGQLVRVAIRAELPDVSSYRLAYVALTDRLPAGFEPVDTDLASTAQVPDLSKGHPFHEGLSSSGSEASHVEPRNDRVQIYFDRVSASGRALYATYVARATTPGQFILPPARGELMYENDSEGWSDAAFVNIQ